MVLLTAEIKKSPVMHSDMLYSVWKPLTQKRFDASFHSVLHPSSGPPICEVPDLFLAWSEKPLCWGRKRQRNLPHPGPGCGSGGKVPAQNTWKETFIFPLNLNSRFSLSTVLKWSILRTAPFSHTTPKDHRTPAQYLKALTSLWLHLEYCHGIRDSHLCMPTALPSVWLLVDVHQILMARKNPQFNTS